MQFHDLGPLWVESAGLPLALHGKRMEAVTSALLVRLGEVVRADWLIDAVWGLDPPPKASAALDTVMWRLRRVLDPERAARAASTVLRTEQQGYRLTVPTDSVDSQKFAAAVGTIRTLDESVDAAGILELTASALTLWRGRPFDGIEAAGWIEPARRELTEHRLTLQRSRISALLAVGQPEQAVSELVPVLDEHPFVESLWSQRILGLYRAGRPSAALNAFRDVRDVLGRELGITPGPELQRLHQRILRQDESLDLPVPRNKAINPGPIHLPRRRTSLIGRASAITAVDRLLSNNELLTVTGAVGCGKTRLAIAVAEQVRSRFTGGVYFADLSDITDLGAVGHRVCQILGLELDTRSSPNSQIAQFTVGRHMLIVLDNCEQVVGAAAALAECVLDADVSTRILATSRRPLHVEGETVFPLHPLELPIGDSVEELAASPAVALFIERVADAGGSVELTEENSVSIAAICAATDGLPLSIELAAARAGVFQLHEVATAVSDNPIALGSAARSSVRPHDGPTLGESIETSYRLLSADERLAYRRFSLLPPGFTLDAAVAVCSGALTAERVTAAIAGLVHQSLLETGEPERTNGPTLFRQLVPIRAHAAQHLQSVGEISTARSALESWLVTVVKAGPLLGHSGQAQWYRRLDDNRRTVTATLDHSISAGPSDEILLTVGRLVVYWLDRLNSDGMQVAKAARAAIGPANDPFASAIAVAAHGSLVAANQETATARPELEGAITELEGAITELAAESDQRPAAGYALVIIAITCWTGDDFELAAVAGEAAGRVGDSLGDANLAVLSRAVRGAVLLWSDRESAVAEAGVVLSDDEHVGNDFAALIACVVLSIAALLDGDGTAGLHWSNELLRRQDRLGVRSLADTLETRGNHYVNAGRFIDAVRCYGAAHLQNTRIGRKWPRHPGTPRSVQICRDALAGNDFDEAWRSGERLGSNDLVQDWL